MLISPQMVYANLKRIDQVDLKTGAFYRRMAQEALANQKISLAMRQAIADRLNGANRLLEMQTVSDGDSY